MKELIKMKLQIKGLMKTPGVMNIQLIYIESMYMTISMGKIMILSIKHNTTK